MTTSLKAQGLIDAPPEVSWEENFGQVFLATLGGLRSLVASVGFLQAYAAWEKDDWGSVDNHMTLVTRMEPREPTYWDEAAWHMAYNAASSFLRDRNLRAAIKNRLYRDHVQRGIEILDKGLLYLPDNKKLLETLGYIYKDRQPNPEMAAKCFLKAAEQGALPFIERLGAYELVKVGDRPSSERAYEILKRYYDMGHPFTGMQSILRDLPILEQRLNIPQAQRIKPPPPEPPRRRPMLKSN